MFISDDVLILTPKSGRIDKDLLRAAGSDVLNKETTPKSGKEGKNRALRASLGEEENKANNVPSCSKGRGFRNTGNQREANRERQELFFTSDNGLTYVTFN